MNIGIDPLLIFHRKFYKDAILYLSLLQKKGYKIHIISDREETLENRASLSMLTDLISEKYNIKIESITFSSGYIKGIYAAKVGCSYLIDMNRGSIKSCSEWNIEGIYFVSWKDAYTKITRNIISMMTSIVLSKL